MGGTVWERDFRCEGFDVSLCSRLSASREASTKNSRFSHLLTNMRVCAMNGYIYISYVYTYMTRVVFDTFPSWETPSPGRIVLY